MAETLRPSPRIRIKTFDSARASARPRAP